MGLRRTTNPFPVSLYGTLAPNVAVYHAAFLDTIADVSVPPPLSLSPRRVCALLFAFALCAAALHGAAGWAQSVSPVALGVSKWFPVSYGHPRTPQTGQVAVTLLGVAGFVVGLRLLPRVPERFRHAVATLIGMLCILCTTGAHGMERGFAHPIAGRDPHAKPAQYWHDAANQNLRTGADALRFVQNYAAIQPTLGEHGRTHPSGAVLLFALLRQVTGNRPALAAVLLCAVSAGLAGWGFARAGASPHAVLLFCALPAVQVYFCATLDALVCGLLFVALTRRRAGTVALLIASFLTFGAVWVVPVLLAVEVSQTRRVPWRTLIVLAATGIGYMVLYAATGFDYGATFRWASHSENPHGFRLLANPLSYVATRLENVADLLFFGGAFLPWAVWHGLPTARRESFTAWAAFGAGVASLCLLFLAGAYRTGETARACLFLYPLAVCVADAAPLSTRARETLLIATVALSGVIQCAGFYFW